MPNFTFYTKPEYYAHLIEQLEHAQPGDRFMTANMVTVPGRPGAAPVLDAMIAAAKRGVTVSLITDARNFLASYDYSKPGPLLFHHRLPKQGMAQEFQVLHDYLEQLAAVGGRTVILNRPSRLFTSPVAGRSHIKFTVINDEYFIGGCNLDSVNHIDLMACSQDAQLAKWLYELGEHMLSSSSAMSAIGHADLTHEIAPGVTLYADSGVRHHSLILEQALAFIDSAQEHITITCQFFPGLITARHLRSAHKRGVKVTILYNDPKAHRSVSSLGFRAAELWERLRMPRDFFAHSYRGPKYIHAKLIATEQGAIIGSHNYVIQGVDFGTAEIALKILDPQFSRRAIAVIKKQL